jgi:hypothetical protein
MRKSLTWAAAGATVAAAMLSVAGTASAATAKPTTLSIEKSPASITAGQSVTISGQLKSGGTALDHEAVALNWVDQYGHLHFIKNGTSAGPAGNVSFTAAPRATTTYELVFNGVAGYARSHSGVVTVPVKKLSTALTISAPPTTPVTVGTKETFTGTLTTGTRPLAGRLVTLWLVTGPKHLIHPVGHGTTSATGAVSISTTPPAGTDYYTLVYGGDWQYAGALSALDKVTVNKVATALSIAEAKGSAAGTETISGTLTAGPTHLKYQTVVLRYKNSKGVWVNVGARGTGATGTVTFTVAPKAATTYELFFAGTPVYAAATSGTVVAG